jgi:hypothetical protein
MAFKHLTYAAIPLIAASMSVSLTAHGATVDQLNRQVQKLNQRIAAQDQRFRVNGFATFGMAIGDEELPYNGIGDEVNLNRFAKVGVQMTFNLDSQNSVVTQLVSRGNSGWDTKAAWAYFKHDFNNGFSSKIGRIRLPAFALSEFLDVGYAVPWAQMPEETYDQLSPFANMDGVDMAYTTDIGDMSATLGLAYGRSTSAGYDLKEITAFNASLQADTWNARLAYSVSKVSITDDSIIGALQLFGEGATDIDGSFASLGVTYDPGDIYFTTEYTSLVVDGTLFDIDAAYATLGYRFGQWMPLLTYAMAKSQDDDTRSFQASADAITGGSIAILESFGPGSAVAPSSPTYADSVTLYQEGVDQDVTRIGLGLRYDMSPGVAVKVQYDIIETNDARGIFADSDFQAATIKPDGSNILTISIDTVF